MVFIEAAACSKPVLAGNAGGTGAAVLDGVTGLRVDGKSVEAVAKGLVRLLSVKEDAIKMGASGWSRVLTHFAWERVAEKTLDLSREMTRSDK
jgi:phosphatidylinositol alpha-1,6-mannosyltransferase